MIEVRELTKRYGDFTAVDSLNFTVEPGLVTGFLGRNGAGKSTTMRMVVGLHRPSAGSVTVSGHRFRDLPVPMHAMGALLDAKAVHPGVSARDHLRVLATSNGIPLSRVEEVLELTGIAYVAKRRAGAFSLGMGQRLGIAAAILGDPPVIMLDEPLNGLDPDGVHWLRGLLREMADQGRTVFFSSHLMSEMALVADRLVILDHGRLIVDTTLDDLLRKHSHTAVQARVNDPRERAQMIDILRRNTSTPVTATSAVTALTGPEDVIAIHGTTAEQVGLVAREAGIALAELTTLTSSLEDVFMDLTMEAPTPVEPSRSRTPSGPEANTDAGDGAPAPTERSAPAPRIPKDHAPKGESS